VDAATGVNNYQGVCIVKIFGLALLAAIGGYIIGLFGGMIAINLFSSNTHDKSLEAAMTSAFFIGPLVAVLAFVLTLVYLLGRGGG
jgi:hypothetical protein